MRDLIPSEDRELAIAICELLDSKKIEKVELFNVAGLSNLADYFVMATISNSIQAKALADFIEESLDKVGIKNLRRDGVNDWIILDYNFVIVHIFTSEVQEFYHLDKLWNDGKNVYSLSSIKKMLEKESKNEKHKINKEEKNEKCIVEKIEKVRKKEEKDTLRKTKVQQNVGNEKLKEKEKELKKIDEKSIKGKKVIEKPLEKINREGKKEVKSKKEQSKKISKK